MPTTEGTPTPSVEPTSGGQAGNAEAPTGQPQEATPASIIEVGGRQMAPEALAKSYTEAETRMRKLENELHEVKGKAEQWDQTNQWVRENPDLWNEMLEVAEGKNVSPQPVAQQFDPTVQELNQLKQSVAAMQIKEQLTAEGATEEEKNAVLKYMGSNPDAKSARMVYRDLFFENKLEAVKQEAAQKTAKEITEGQRAYPLPPPSGGSPSPDTVKMTPEERDNAVLNDLANSDWSDIGV